MKIEEVFARRRFIMLDGAMGTQLQLRGLTTEQKPELAAFIMPDVLTAVHRDYARAGADILLANTFGANPRKLKGTGYTVQQVIEASIACARTAAQETGALVALDIGPIGELLAPAGTLPFEDACAQFAEMVRAGAAAGADLVFLETMTDLYELKAAILAAKENCDLPVFTSMSFEARGRTFTGCTVESYGITAAGLGADAVGINCSLGPKEILPFAQRLCRVVPAGMPVFVKPNAGLPNLDGSYDITPAEFAAEMAAYLPTGISMLGGCCGSEPESIRLLKELTQDKTPAAKTPIVRSRLCTPVRCVEVNGITVVGERINPTGKKRLQQALREGDSAYACAQAVAQAEAGAELLDVNAGLPDIDEPATLEMLVRELQSITDLPLQLDSSNKDALARALRIYNGKPIVNSVNGEQKVLDSILPLCKKYGAAVVGLALDEHGIPKTAEGRFEVAKRIVAATDAIGIPRGDVYIDCLTLTVSAEQSAAAETLKAITMCKKELGVRTVCLDPAADAPAFNVCDDHIVAAYDDAAALEELCRRSDAVTYEFENVPGDILIPLCGKYNIPQGYKPLYDSQDRLREKSNARDHGLRTPGFEAVDDEASLREAVRRLGLPAVLKTRTLGYDGHGQRVLKTEADIAGALPLLAVPCILEEFVPFDSEASIVMVADGERVVSFPVGRNVHRDGILDLCIVPAEVDSGVLARMKAQSERFMRDCGYRGILAIEYFIKGGEIYFNEMAPRPHNSGHYTIEGATTNQFRELVRYLVGEPLQEPQPVAPTVMKNILGQDLEAAERIAAENLPGVYVHLYGKTESRNKRKMGHITFVGMDAARFEAEWAGRFVK